MGNAGRGSPEWISPAQQKRLSHLCHIPSPPPPQKKPLCVWVGGAVEEMGLVVGAEMGTSMVSIEGEMVRPLGAGQGERGTPSAPKGVAEGVGCGTEEEGGGGPTLCTTIL